MNALKGLAPYEVPVNPTIIAMMMKTIINSLIDPAVSLRHKKKKGDLIFFRALKK